MAAIFDFKRFYVGLIKLPRPQVLPPSGLQQLGIRGNTSASIQAKLALPLHLIHKSALGTLHSSDSNTPHSWSQLFATKLGKHHVCTQALESSPIVS